MNPKIKEMIEHEAVEYDAGHIESSAFIVGATFMHDYYEPKLKKAIEVLEYIAHSRCAWQLSQEVTRKALAELSEDALAKGE